MPPLTTNPSSGDTVVTSLQKSNQLLFGMAGSPAPMGLYTTLEPTNGDNQRSSLVKINALLAKIAASGGGGGGSASGVSAPLANTFTIPAVGSSAQANVVMPWVDPGDTVSMWDGTHQFKGTVLANSGSALSLLNPGYYSSSSPGAAVASGAPVSLTAPTQFASDCIYWCDDFDRVGFTNNQSVPGNWQSTTGGTGWAPAEGDHFGIVKLLAPQSSLLGWGPDFGTVTQGGGVSFGMLQKAVVRFVIKCDNAPETAKNEWWCGFFNSPSQQQAGALFSSAQGSGWVGTLPNANNLGGFVDNTTGFVCATYDTVSSGKYGYLQSGFAPVAGQWMDIIVVWTPAENRFYIANYGTRPQLVASIFTDVCADYSIYPAVCTNSPNTNLYLDRVEVLYLPKNAGRFMGNRMLGL